MYFLTQKTSEEDKEDAQDEEEENNTDNSIEDLCSQDGKRQSIIYDVLPKQDKGGTYTWVSIRIFMFMHCTCIMLKHTIYIYFSCKQGFFLEGAQWDREKRSLMEMSKKKLHDQLPVILFQPAVSPEGSNNCGKMSLLCEYHNDYWFILCQKSPSIRISAKWEMYSRIVLPNVNDFWKQKFISGAED